MWGSKLSFDIIENSSGNSGTIPMNSEYSEYSENTENTEYSEYPENTEYPQYSENPEYSEKPYIEETNDFQNSIVEVDDYKINEFANNSNLYRERLIIIPERSLFNIRLKMKKSKIDYATMKCLKIN